MDNASIAQYFAAKLEAEWGPHDLKKRLDAKDPTVVVVDARDPESFKKERIPGAVNIPAAEIEARWQEVEGKIAVCYCWSITCHLAARAALRLLQKGVSAKELAGGIDVWKRSEFPTEKAEPALAR